MNSTLSMLRVREALEASWDKATAYQGAFAEDIPALGQCYVTSRVLQLLYPVLEIAEGQVWTGIRLEKHFWNVLKVNGVEAHLDLTWQQFPPGSTVQQWKIRDRETLNDSEATVTRVQLLLGRVKAHLGSVSNNSGPGLKDKE